MHARPLLLLAGVFGAAALATAFVTTQLPREGQVSGERAPPVSAPLRSEPSPLAEPAATERDGTLEIRVSVGGEPISGAEVRVYSPPAPGAGEGGWRIAGRARADQSAIARVFARPGTYLVTARAQGLAPGRAEAVRSPGEEVSRVEVALEAPVALAGRVSTGRGDAADTRPVAHARVRAVQIVSRWPVLAPPSAPPEEIAVAEGDARGTFRLDGLAPGTYAVSVEAPDRHPLALPHVTVPSGALAVALEALGTIEGSVRLDGGRQASGAAVRAASAEHAVETTVGQDGRFALRAPAGTYRVSAALGDRAGVPGPVEVAAGATSPRVDVRLGPSAAIEGQVVLSSSGRPLPRAEIAVAPHGATGVEARATAGADGRFRVQGLAPGSFDVSASAPGATPASLGGVTVAAGARHFLRVPLEGTGAIEGRVHDPAGRPLASIGVMVARRGGGLASAAPLQVRTDFDGRFRFDAVEVGRAELVARDEPVLTGTARAVRVEEGRTSRADLVLPEAGILTGFVAQGHGAPPPAGTTVVAVPMTAGLGTLQVARVAADARGSYHLALPAGDYRVHAAPADADSTDVRVAPSFARVLAGRTSRLDLLASTGSRDAGTAVLVLEPGGAPSPGAVVTIARERDARVALATTAGEDGRVVLPADMGMAGRVATVRARNGGRTGETTAELPRSGTVTVVLAQGGAVVGAVRGLGSGRPGYTVEVASRPEAAGWRNVDLRRFDGDSFSLSDLPAEPLRLTVRTDDGRRGEAEVRVAAGETRTVTIALEPAAGATR